MPNLTAEQIEKRRGAVMASDLPIIMGLSTFKSPMELALIKRGEIEPDFEPLLSRDIGHIIEPITWKLWEEETGKKARLNKRSFYGSGKNKHHGATPDGFIIEDGKRAGLLELKYSTAGAKWRTLPDDVFIQVQWQLHVTKKDRADVAGLIAYKGTNLKVHEVNRDDRFIGELVKIADEFMEAINSGHLPKPMGTASESAALEKYYNRERSGIAPLERHDPELIEILDGMEDLGGRIRSLTAEKNKAKNALKVYIGENTTMLSGGYRVSWKRPADKQVTDWEAVANAVVESAAKKEFYGDVLDAFHTAVEGSTEDLISSRRLNVYKKGE